MSDTQNPVYVDNVTMAGDGTEEHPLAVVNPVTPQQIANIPSTVSMVITSAQLKALKATPVVLVPAVAGKRILPFFSLFSYIPNTTGYTTPAGSALVLSTAAQIAVAGQDTWNTESAAATLGGTGSAAGGGSFLSNLTSGLFQGNQAALVGSPLVLTKDLATAEFTLGDGTLLVEVVYEVI